MPLYEYRCPDCGARYEVLVFPGNDEPAECFHCDAPLEKVIQPAALVFRGEGFHCNDYPNGASDD